VLPLDERGSGEPVVLLHAGVADRSMWREHLEPLAQAGLRAVAPDLPGFGDAPVQPGGQAPWADVLRTLRELGIERAAIVGNSFGAAVALRVAAVAPAVAASLLLVSPPPLARDPSPRLRAVWEAEETAIKRGDVDAAVAAVVEAWVLPGTPAALRQRVAAMYRRGIERQLAAGDVDEAPDPLEQRPEILRNLSVPVLAIAGAEDMADFKAGAREIAELVPHGRVEEIPNAGHLAPLEAPEAFRARLLAFLGQPS
jgi:pimeloyl-ACP methyl ester carboxylesterase